MARKTGDRFVPARSADGETRVETKFADECVDVSNRV
jgi:hypothetical protein